MSINFSIITR